MSGEPGRLAVVLHSHMPYVEGYGTWPFGEEWLFEAVATSYVPLLPILRDAPVTLGATPVLLDQLEAPGLHDRLMTFLRELRATTHELDARGCRESGREDLAAEVERAGREYAAAADVLAELGEGGLGAELARLSSWTSTATHAVLPLVATDAGVRLQLRAGIESHRERAGDWGGGLWLPECAHASWLDPLLEEAGVHAVCVDVTDVGVDPLRPLRSSAGPLLVPIDRRIMELVWHDAGYPCQGAYRDYHRHTVHHHRPWAIDGSVYDADRATEQARADARDFVGHVARRVAGGGLCVCALDTELLGHWWYEGPAWLGFVVEECRTQGVELVALDDALAGCRSDPAPEHLPVTTWGTPRDLSTWSAPAVADLAVGAREAELRVVAAGAGVPERAVRELLALQSSDWAFLVTRDLAGDYPRERAAGHRAALDAALRGDPEASEPRVRNLAPRARPALLLEP